MDSQNEVSIKFSNEIKDEKKLQEYEERLSRIYSFINGLNNGQSKAFAKIDSATKATTKEVDITEKSIEKLGKQFSVAFNAKSLSVYLKGLYNISKQMFNLVSASSAYIENVNLLEVAYAKVDENTTDYNEAVKESSKSVKELINQMSDVYGFDESRLTRSFGIFRQMANAMKLPTETAENLSEHLVKMSNDIASLYNLDLSRAENALQSALAGQVRPIRSATGADITEKTLQTTVDNLGLDRSINQLSYVEKRLIMIISLTDQLKVSQGDYGRTIESVSNQIRVMHEQWDRVSRAVGNIFYPILKKILPVINAILMVITEIANRIASFVASLLGVDLEEDFDYSNLAGISDSANDIIEGMDGASESVDNLKQKMSGLRGFDKLNVITTPKDTSSANTGAGIDPAIMDAFNDAFGNYDDMLDEVNMKARKIRDAILDWLGFTDGTYKNLKLIGILLGAFAGYKIFKTLKGLFTGESLLGKALGTGGLYKTLKKIFGKKDEAKNGIGATGEVVDATSNASKSMKEFKLPSYKTILKGLAEFAIIVGGVIALVEVIGLFMKIPGAKDTLDEGLDTIGRTFLKLGLISPFILAAGVAFKVMGEIGIKTFAKGLADFAIIVGGTVGLITAIGALMSIPNFKDFVGTGIEQIQKVFKGIYEISLPLIFVGSAFGIMGSIGISIFAKGFADFAIIIGGTMALITIIGGLLSLPYATDFVSTGIDMVKKVFQGLWDIAIPIVGMSAILIALGVVSPLIAPGILAFSAVVLSLMALMEVIGALRQIEGFDWLVTQGGDLLVTMAEYIGKFAGAIIAGFVDKAFEGLEKVGTHLANFMINAQPFFDGLSKVDVGTTEAVNNLASCILKLTAADILDGLTSWFTGGSSIVDFGKELAEFAPYFAQYAKEVENVNPDVVKASADAAMSLAEFAHKLPNEGGILAKLVGDNILEDFGKMLPNFGKYMKKYSDNIDGINSAVVKESADAALSLAEMANKLPNKGGVASWFAGDNTLEDFSKTLPGFGKNFKSYYNNIKGLNTEVVKNSADAAESLAQMAQKLPNKGGIVSWFTGDNTLADFGKNLKDFGGHFKEYYNKVKGISIDKINQVTGAIEKIVKYYKTIKNEGLTKVVTEFGVALKNTANDVSSFLKTKFDENKGWQIGSTFGKGFANGMINSIRNATFPKIKLTSPEDGTLQTYRLSAYAKGGLPPVGQLFVANEQGPELVGQIGGQSFVANQNQMMNLLDKKIGNAQSQPMNATFVIQVGSKEVARQVITDLQGMAKSNGKPITIG